MNYIDLRVGDHLPAVGVLQHLYGNRFELNAAVQTQEAAQTVSASRSAKGKPRAKSASASIAAKSLTVSSAPTIACNSP